MSCIGSWINYWALMHYKFLFEWTCYLLKCYFSVPSLQEWVAKFEKPKGDPSSFLKPATTVLSPYLKVSDELRVASITIISASELWHASLKDRLETEFFFKKHFWCFSLLYLVQFGCLSSRYFYQCIQESYKNVKHHTSPPVSLLGQVSSGVCD